VDRFNQILSTKLLTLSGVPVTVASLATCVLTFLIGLIIAKVLSSAARRAIVSRGRPAGVAAAVGKIVWYLIVSMVAFVSLDTLGFNLTAVVAGSAVLLVGIGFGLQNIAQNFVSGLIVLFERPVKEGDFIRVGEVLGEVRAIGLRGTKVVSRDEITVIVPNSELVSAEVVNLSVPTSRIRIAIRVGVAYGSDVARVRDALLRVAAQERGVLANPAPEVRFDDFADSSLAFVLLVWIADPRDDWRISSDLRFAIDAEFRKEEIVIAFPQRDLHLKSGLEILRAS